MIKNKEILTNQIMGESRHQFVYGYNGKEREEFLKSVALKYPIILDKSSPIGIYICDKCLPELPKESEALDRIAIQIFYRDYVNYLIASSILGTAIVQIDEKTLAEHSKELLDRSNSLFIAKDRQALTGLIGFKKMLDEAKELYYYEYVKYIASGELHDFNSKIPVRIIMMDAFIRYFKRMVNTNSYLGIIFDQQEPLAKGVQKAINNYVSARINSDISMKVSCEPDEWKSYYDSNGVFIESVHDYGDVQLDSCYEDYVKKIKERRQIHLGY
jgi:hypothetical protein